MTYGTKMNRRVFLCLGVVLVTLPMMVRGSVLEPPSTGGLLALDPILSRLATHKRLLIVAAHPDDEDSTLLTLVTQGLGGEAAYLSLSRGEGGQNLIGSELGVALGLLRSQELLAARRVDGAQQFFTRAYDFGYTRSLEETFRFWPKAVLLEDVVAVVRRFRPQVVVSVFPATGQAGHGQHQAAGVLAQESFDVAGGEDRFPSLTAAGLPPWRPTTFYRSARFRPVEGNLVLPTGGLDPMTGRSYYQIAMASRSMHRSQDMGRLQQLGPRETRVSWEKGGGGAAERELFGGIDTRLAGMVSTLGQGAERVALESSLNQIQGLIGRLREELRPADLERSVPLLVEVLEGFERVRRGVAQSALPQDQKLIVGELLEEKIHLARKAVAIAAGIAMDATVEQELVVPGGALRVEATLYNAGTQSLRVVPTLNSPGGWLSQAIQGEAQEVAPGQMGQWGFAVYLENGAPMSVPYFLARPLQGALYDWDAVPQALRTAPFAPPPLTTEFRIQRADSELAVEREVVYRYGDQAVGEIRRPLRAVPRLEVEVEPRLLVWPTGEGAVRQLEVTLDSHVDGPLRGALHLSPPAGWPEASPVPFTIEDGQGRLVVKLDLEAPRQLDPGRYQVGLAAVLDGGQRYDLALPPVDYDHVRPVAVPKPAQVEIQSVPLRLPPLRAVGYIRGASDRVPESLSAIGVPVRLLSVRELAQAGADSLSHFDAVVVGSRAYETHPHLAQANGRLLDYVRGGGLLIVQYQQYQFVRGEFAPYPLTITRPHDRVTDEEATVHVLDPDHPTFHRPHRIVDSDWSGWVQERGLYFPRSWDEAYTPLLRMSDPGGPELQGALLVARLGEGTYIYTGLAFFRQLPAGVPGAYRLFANLLALSRGNPG